METDRAQLRRQFRRFARSRAADLAAMQIADSDPPTASGSRLEDAVIDAMTRRTLICSVAHSDRATPFSSDAYGEVVDGDHPAPTEFFAESIRRLHEIIPSGFLEEESPAGELDLPESEIVETLAQIDAFAASAVDVDMLGELHQAFEGRRLSVDAGKAAFQRTGKRRSGGIFYTPREVVDYVVDRTLGRRLYATENGRPDGDPLEGVRPLSVEEARNLRILDPAMGAGAFLTRMLDRLIEFYERTGEVGRREASTPFRQIYGVDLDPRAVEHARWNLVLASGEATSPVDLRRRLRCGNALLFPNWPLTGSAGASADWEAVDDSPFDWSQEFPEVFEGLRGGFDIVVGNPPWISYGLRNAGKMADEMKTYLRAQFDAAQYKLPLYPLFMELGVRLCAPDGVSSLVVPDSFPAGSRFSDVRRFLAEESSLRELTVLPENIWAGRTSGRTIVYRTKRTDHPGQTDVRHAASGDPRTARAERRISAGALASPPDFRIDLLADDAMVRLVEQMRATDAVVDDFGDLYSGCIARYGQATVSSGERTDRHVIRDREGCVVLDDDAAFEKWKPLVASGGDVAAFEVEPTTDYIYFHPDREVRRSYLKSGFDAERYRRAKLFMRQTGDCLVAAWDGEGRFCFNNLHVINARGTRDQLRFLLGVLNSRSLRLYYQSISMERGRSLAQTDIETIEQLPVPQPPQEIVGDIASEVAQITTLREQGAFSRAQRLESEVDDWIRDLYGLEATDLLDVESALDATTG